MVCPFRCYFKAETYLAKVHNDPLQGRDSTVSTNTKTCNFHFLLPPSHKCYYFTLIQLPFPFSSTELPRIVFHKPHGVVNAAWVVSFWIGRVFIHLNPRSQTFLFVQLCTLIGRYHTNHCLSGQWPLIAVYSIFKTWDWWWNCWSWSWLWCYHRCSFLNFFYRQALSGEYNHEPTYYGRWFLQPSIVRVPRMINIFPSCAKTCLRRLGLKWRQW